MGTTKARFIELHGEEAWEKEAERRNAKSKKYQQEHKEQIAKKKKQWYKTNKEVIAEKRKENSEEHKAYCKQWHRNNAEHDKNYKKQYRQSHKKEINDYQNDYRQTQNGRAAHISSVYAINDKEKDFDTSNNIDREWIINNIYASQCTYCGDNDWTHLGADRIDNAKPHTPENCIPACFICNIERNNRQSVEEFKEYRSLHPRVLGDKPEKSWEIIELESGLKVIKKKQQTP